MMKNYFDKITTKQWRTILYVLGVINLGFFLFVKWQMVNLIIAIATFTVAATMKDK